VEINKKKLSEQVYEILKSDIISHKIGSGERLTNRDLQKRYNVSSSPVRDAINHLYLDGLVENISNSGAKVITFNLKLALEVNEVVSVLCCAALELSINSPRGEKLCAQLEALINNQEKAASVDKYLINDYLFHKSFFDFSENSQLSMIYERYHVLWEMLVRHYHNLKHNQSDTINQHRDILKAYGSSNAKESLNAMKEHFIFAGELFKKNMV
jgi:DNA-binding GntR family transcriptional regulator